MWTLSATVEDGEGEKGVTTIYLPSATTLANAELYATEWAESLITSSLGRMTRLTVTKDAPLPASNPAVGAGSGHIEQKGVLSFRTSQNHVFRMSVPALDPALAPYGEDELDTNGTALEGLINNMVDGVEVVPGTTVQPCDSRGEDIASLDTALDGYGKKRRG